MSNKEQSAKMKALELTLGKLENVVLSDADEFYDEIFNTNPYCEGVYMTDDYGNIIL